MTKTIIYSKPKNCERCNRLMKIGVKKYGTIICKECTKQGW